MDLYFMPMACSMATRIALHEMGVEANFIEVDPATKTTPDAGDYREVNPLGLVPTLRTDDGELLTENVAVLQHVASLGGGAVDPRLTEQLAFISSELHTRLFSWLFDRTAPPEARRHAVEKGRARLEHLDRKLADRRYLLDEFSVADAYLLTVLNWAQATPVDLSPFPNLTAYLERGRERPSVKASVAIELPLYLEEQRRAKGR